MRFKSNIFQTPHLHTLLLNGRFLTTTLKPCLKFKLKVCKHLTVVVVHDLVTHLISYILLDKCVELLH